MVNRKKILVFPKLFELYLFILSLKDDEHCHMVTLKKGLWCTEIFLDANSFGEEKGSCAKAVDDNSTLSNETEKYIRVDVICPESSDVTFMIKINNYLNELKAYAAYKDSVFSLILCGTCGSTEGYKDTKYNIGYSFYAHEAIKYDRGKITEATVDSNPKKLTLEIDHKKKVSSFGDMNLDECGCKILSSNHILEIDPHEIDKTVHFADMETFEFFESCRLMEIQEFASIRVVSDVSGYLSYVKTLPDDIESLRLLKRMVRKVTSFSSARDKIVRLLQINGYEAAYSQLEFSICNKPFIVSYKTEIKQIIVYELKRILSYECQKEVVDKYKLVLNSFIVNNHVHDANLELLQEAAA